MSLLPYYKHIIKPKLKHIYMSFDEQGVLVIKSPNVSPQQIETLLLKKATWIRNAQTKIKNKKGKNPDFSKASHLYFLGQAHTLLLSRHKKKYSTLLFDGEIFVLSYSHYDPKVFQKHIDAFYKKETQAYIPALLQSWAARMNLDYQKVSFRKTKRQWGSCSGTNHISINTMIMKLPLDVIEYIVVHELVHIKHKHHQKAFWDDLAKYLPHYKKQVMTLKEFTT